MIRQLPAGFALVIRGGLAPVIARLPRAWRNPAHRRARRHGDVLVLPARRHFLPAEPEPDPDPDEFPDYPPPGWAVGDSPAFPWRT